MTGSASFATASWPRWAPSQVCGIWRDRASTSPSTARPHRSWLIFPGVARVLTDGRRVHIEVDGQVQPLIDALAATGVRTMVSREASLEEMFLAHCGTTGSHDGATGELRPPRQSTAGTRS